MSEWGVQPLVSFSLTCMGPGIANRSNIKNSITKFSIASTNSP